MGPLRRGSESGWGRRIRTPATWSRATRPTTRRSPNAPPFYAAVSHPVKAKAGQRRRPAPDEVISQICRAPAPGPPAARARERSGEESRPGLQDCGLERAAGLEARDLGGRDLDDLAGAGVAAVTLGPPADHERAEAADGDAPALLERLEDGVEEGVERTLRGDLGHTRGLRHDRDQLRPCHAIISPSGATEVKRSAAAPRGAGRPR